MGRCHEFGSQIREGCRHPMRAGQTACSCPECGVVCEGQFDGCPDVWARGPRLLPVDEPDPSEAMVAFGRPRHTERPPSDDFSPAMPSPLNGDTFDDPPTNRTMVASLEDEPRTEVFRWFEEAFDGLRNELRALAGGLTQQQAMMNELMESRQADLRLAVLAESIPALVDDAVRKAMADHSVAMLDFVDSSLGDFRDSLKRTEAATRAAQQAATEEQLAELEAVKQAVAKQLKPVAAAIRDAVAVQQEAKDEDAARLPALKASVTRQLRPLEEAMERSDRRLKEISDQLKRIATASPPGAARTKPRSGPAPRRP